MMALSLTRRDRRLSMEPFEEARLTLHLPIQLLYRPGLHQTPIPLPTMKDIVRVEDWSSDRIQDLRDGVEVGCEGGRSSLL